MNRDFCFNAVDTDFIPEHCVCAPEVSVIEGADIYDTLCPVSKLTGRRENPLSLLGKITGAKSELLNAVLQEIPTIASDPRLTDKDRVDFIVSRLSSGTPAEDALMTEKLMIDLDALGLSSKSAPAEVKTDTIEFKEGDAPSSES